MASDDTNAAKSAALPMIFNETTKYAAATGLAAIYICGYLITTLSNAKYGFYDSELLRPKVMTAGLVFAIAIGYPLYILAIARKLCKFSTPEPTLRDRMVAFFAYFTVVNALIAFSTIFTMGVCEPQFQSPHSLKLILWSAVDFITWFILAAVESSYIQKRNAAQSLIATLLIICGIAAFYLSYLAIYGAWGSPQYGWAYGIAMASTIETNLDIGDFDKFKKYPWFQTTASCFIAMSFFSQLIYPKLKPFWGGSLEDITITLQQNLTNTQQPMKVKLIDASAEGYYVLLNNSDRATYFPRSSIARIDYR
jgi:arginine exporter protein ArgO